jgi:hypothetical protein
VIKIVMPPKPDEKAVSSGNSWPMQNPASSRVRHGESLMAKITVTFTITEFCLHTGLSEEELRDRRPRHD